MRYMETGDIFKDAEERERTDQAAARKSPLWDMAVTFLATELADISDQIQHAVSNDPADWSTEYHFGWGMSIRNLLRANGFAEADMGVQNLDNVYVPLVEEAMRRG